MSGFHEPEYVPLSVREGGRRAKLAWWWKGRRQSVALKLAPWFTFAGGRMTHDAWELSQQRAVRVLQLEAAARDVIAAADMAYGSHWRSWKDKATGPERGARALSKTLCELDAAVSTREQKP